MKTIRLSAEAPSIYPDLTAYENLKMQCLTLGLNQNLINENLQLVGLDNTGKKKSKDFSLGMRQRLGLAIALISSPDMILLDEPTNGLDPEGIIEIRELLIKLRRTQNLTIIISSHNLSELSKLATCYGFINNGQLIKEITAQELSHLCKRCIILEVSNSSFLPQIFERELGLRNYKLTSQTCAEIYDEISISDLAAALNRQKISIAKLTERDEDLESFYINLIGGEK